jgi:hypothetical protein
MTYADPPLQPGPFTPSLRFLQRFPHLLEIAYAVTCKLLEPFRRWLRPGGIVERLFVAGELATKGPIFDCHMCGQCILHSTGMTCPQTCPKNLRNGPCGGVRPDGRCEILPDLPCVWVEAWERSKHMPDHGRDILRLVPPLDRRLRGTSAWINDFTGAASTLPSGWSS